MPGYAGDRRIPDRPEKHTVDTCPECSGGGTVKRKIFRGEKVCGTCDGHGKTWFWWINGYKRMGPVLTKQFRHMLDQQFPGVRYLAKFIEQAEQVEAHVTAGMSVVPVSQRPMAPCENCGRLVVVGAKRCDGCGHSGFNWTCNTCGGVFVETRIGLMYCVRCKGFWR